MFRMTDVCVCSLVLILSLGGAEIAAQWEGNDNFTRLLGGASPNEGVFQYRGAVNEWHTFCSLEYSAVLVEAPLLCKLAGYSVFCSVHKLNVSPVNASLLHSLAAFPLGKFGFEPTCTLDDALWLTCDSDFELKLEHGYHEDEGILQARCNDKQQWQLVCGDDWLGSRHAHYLACRHLGYPVTVRGSAFVMPKFILRNTYSIFLHGAFCSGQEDNLTNCYLSQHHSSCRNYAGLMCTNQRPNIQLRLVDGKHDGSGVLQGRFRPTDDWGAICSDYWDGRDSQVACRHLGFFGQVRVTESQISGESRTNVSLVPESMFLSAVGCHGNETELSQCNLVSDVEFSCEGFPYVECMEVTTRFDVPAYLCGKKNYCGYECNPDQFDPEIMKGEVCKCDDACVYFNDCCYDYRANCNPAAEWGEIQINTVSLEHYSCVWVPGYDSDYDLTGFALVSSCPDTLADSFLRQKCERKAALGDLVGILPVYVVEGAVYKNVFCALCHGIKTEQLHTWKASIEYINGNNVTHYPHLNMTIKGTPTGRIMFSPRRSSSGLQGVARRCPIKTTGTCLEEYRNTTLEDACRDYFASVKVGSFRFHNPHCAMCNNLTVQPTATCQKQKFTPRLGLPSVLEKWDLWDRYPAFNNLDIFPVGWSFDSLDRPLLHNRINTFSIEDIFDFGWGNDENIICPPEQLFVPSSGECGTALSLSGVAKEDGDFLDGLQTPNNSSSQWFSLLDDNCNAGVLASFGNAASYWEAVPLQGTVFDPDLDVKNFPEEFSLSVFVKTIDKINTFLGNAMAIFENSSSVFRTCNITTAAMYLEEGAFALSQINVCSNASMKAKCVVQTSIDNNYTSVPDSTVLKLFTWIGRGVYAESAGRVSLSVQKECLDVLELIQNCSDVKLLHPNEYMFDYIQLSLWNVKNYVPLPDGKVGLCGPIDPKDFGNFALGVVSVVCSCLSLLALAATFVTYCAFPELRNTGGLVNMNLMGALFIAILNTVLSGVLQLEGYVCMAAASMSHWLWLSAFAWMAIISCNVARTFGRTMVVASRRSKPKCRRLLVSMAFAWGGALLVVSICLLLNFCNCTDLPPMYSESQPCWIAETTVRLVVFGIPVALSLLVSTVAFAIVIFKIRKTKKDSKMVRTRRQIEETFDELKIYGKLMLLFGTSWVLAFVSEAVSHVVLSYISVIVNTLQGVFIFLAFCLNQRVRALWRKSLSCFACRNAEQRKSASDVPLHTISTRGSFNGKSGAGTAVEEFT
ncbi:uncharacterized protein LOC110986690 [Acanthaster planci]|uniref:Uncharacterized protein LOC110986690 n=1 Tax=Acanthaster planci TaxID=133434 RepID=A0A8B7ZFQ5_ACAPL|nr:uncharacterized protein LOC110986690 [Acanthaster planci]